VEVEVLDAVWMPSMTDLVPTIIYPRVVADPHIGLTPRVTQRVSMRD